ncbi:response regulator transcription factor [Tsuneonella sp. HG249]
MFKRQVIHFVDADARMRGHLARTTLALGHHAEVYADVVELCEHSPQRGIAVVRDDFEQGGIEAAIELLGRYQVWLPVVAIDEAPETSRVVAAVKAGALDYLRLPLDPSQLSQMLLSISHEAEATAAARRRMIEARSRIDNLSVREREVLEWLAQGSSNKAIAKALQISPRTVEIHRANMMNKLGASHSADAVRLRLEASL